MSRVASSTILKALKDYHKALGLEWDTEGACWWFTWNGERAWVYRHADGIIALEPSKSECLDICRRYDRRNGHGLNDKANIAVSRKRTADFNAKVEREAMEEAGKEAQAIAKVKLAGSAKPFVHLNEKPKGT